MRTKSLVPAKSAARTATFTSDDLAANGARGLQIVVDVTVIPSGGLTLSLKTKDPASGKYKKQIADQAKISSTGTYIYELWPGAPVAAGDVTARVNACLPETFQLVVTPDDTTSITYSIGLNLLATGQH